MDKITHYNRYLPSCLLFIIIVVQPYFKLDTFNEKADKEYLVETQIHGHL